MAETGRVALLLDANVIIDVVKLACLQQVASLADFSILVVDEVVEEVKQPAQVAALERAIESGLVGRVTLEAPAEQELLARLRETLGSGEAASLACASTRGYLFATDEKQSKLMREVRDRLGERRLVRSTTLLARAVAESLVSLRDLEERIHELSEQASSPRDLGDADHLAHVVAEVRSILEAGEPR